MASPQSLPLPKLQRINVVLEFHTPFSLAVEKKLQSFSGSHIRSLYETLLLMSWQWVFPFVQSFSDCFFESWESSVAALVYPSTAEKTGRWRAEERVSPNALAVERLWQLRSVTNRLYKYIVQAASHTCFFQSWSYCIVTKHSVVRLSFIYERHMILLDSDQAILNEENAFVMGGHKEGTSRIETSFCANSCKDKISFSFPFWTAKKAAPKLQSARHTPGVREMTSRRQHLGYIFDPRLDTS